MECISCCECFTANLKAVLLPCLHNICEECVQDIRKEGSIKLSCVECGESVELNALRNMSVTIAKEQPATESEKAIGCEKHPTNQSLPVEVCWTCHEIYCSRCKKGHVGHQILSMQEAELKYLQKLKDAQELINTIDRSLAFLNNVSAFLSSHAISIFAQIDKTFSENTALRRAILINLSKNDKARKVLEGAIEEAEKNRDQLKAKVLKMIDAENKTNQLQQEEIEAIRSGLTSSLLLINQVQQSSGFSYLVSLLFVLVKRLAGLQNMRLSPIFRTPVNFIRINNSLKLGTLDYQRDFSLIPETPFKILSNQGAQQYEFKSLKQIQVNNYNELIVYDQGLQKVLIFNRNFEHQNSVSYTTNPTPRPNSRNPTAIDETHTTCSVKSDHGETFILSSKGFVEVRSSIFDTTLKTFGHGILTRPTSIAILPPNHLVIAESPKFKDTGIHQVSIWTMSGERVKILGLNQDGKSGTEPGQFKFPTSVAVFDDGAIVVLDFGNCRIQVF